MASRGVFQPHGLIKSQMQHELYKRAHIANVYTGLTNPKEYETVALMEVVLYKNIFNDDNFAVTSEQPPSLTSGRRCDLVIKYLESGSFDIKVLCFAECKRTDTDREFNLARLERQAKGYCQIYLDAEQDLPFVYAATMAGAHVRLWRYNRDGRWTTFWGTEYEGDWAEYKDRLCYQISTSTHVIFLEFFKEHGIDKVECSVVGEKNHIKLPRHGWQHALMQDHNGDYTGFVYVGKSGKVYFTWSMDAKGKGKGR